MGKRGSDSKSQSSRLSSPPCSSQSDGRRKRPLGDGIDKGKNSLGLVEGLGKLDKVSDGFRVKERFF